MYADLHLHTTYSDGTDTPFEICKLAQAHRVKVIAITDHDTVNGHKALTNEQIPDDVKVITGIEISTEINRKMLHILGYYIDIFDPRLERFMDEISAQKTETTRINFENARANHVFSYEWERVLELNPNQTRMSGVQVVKAMQTDGYQVPGMGLWDMFRKYFWPENDDYISCATFTGHDAIDIIKTVGGVPVIAHPKNIQDDGIVMDLIRHGAQGIEVYHPVHAGEDTEKYLQMAKDKKLYISGGSDWHGKNSGTLVKHFAVTGLAHDDYDLLKVK